MAKILLVEDNEMNRDMLSRRLARRGHDIQRPLSDLAMGRGQIIWRLENGVLAGGSEPRADGQVAAW